MSTCKLLQNASRQSDSEALTLHMLHKLHKTTRQPTATHIALQYFVPLVDVFPSEKKAQVVPAA